MLYLRILLPVRKLITLKVLKLYLKVNLFDLENHIHLLCNLYIFIGKVNSKKISFDFFINYNNRRRTLIKQSIFTTP